MDKCLICNRTLTEGDTTNVSKGLETLISASHERNDYLHKKLEGKDSVVLHSACRKKYTRKSSIVATKRYQTSQNVNETCVSKKLRSSVQPFDFKKHCLFCGEEAVVSSKISVSERKTIHEVRTLEITKTILEYAEKRHDDWANTVTARVNLVSDLVAAEAIYHKDCYVKFSKIVKNPSKGRPQCKCLQESFKDLCQYLEDAEDCQHSMKDLMLMLNRNSNLTDRYVKDFLSSNLQQRFGERLLFFTKGGETYVLIADCYSRLPENWYRSKEVNEEEEKKRIVEAAANIIRKDILLSPYDKNSYPTSDMIKEGAEDLIPETLKTFMIGVTKRRSRPHDDMDNIRTKRIAICHSIIAACRPRTFLSPIQCSLGLYVSRCFGSRHLIDLLNSLGFCCSYYEAELYQASLLNAGEPLRTADSFSQFIFDNADINVRTLDGHGTFHAMGGIECITPSDSVQTSANVKRLKTAEFSGKFNIPIVYYVCNSNNHGLRSHIFADLTGNEHNDNPDVNTMIIKLNPLNLIWLSGGANGDSSFPGWHGFMHKVFNTQKSEELDYQTSYILALPFINMDPGNLTCIYSALTYASQQATRAGKKNTLVTFDQPLYLKACKVICENQELSNVQIRLGGFHLLISFLGCLGKFMEGSGIEDLWGTVYGKAVIRHLLSGHAYARSYRAHMLTQSALVESLCNEVPEIKAILNKLHTIFKDLTENLLTVEQTLRSELVANCVKQFSNCCNKIASKSRTSKLWLQEFTLVDIVQRFILAERTGNWELHLTTVQEMLPYFHAAGHFNYAKSAQLYLQEMMILEEKLTPKEFHDFTSKGFFTIRRNKKFFTGTWSDMCIEQSLMRSIKSVGGLTHGRGLSDNTIAKYILCAPRFLQISEALLKFTGTSAAFNEQHVELRDSRKIRDATDITKFVEWFRLHPPFGQEEGSLICISTGLVVTNNYVNCDDAQTIGKKNMKKWVGKNFDELKFERKNVVKSIATVKNGVFLRSKTTFINPEQLFHRVMFLSKNTGDFKKYLKYELCSYPPSLFENRTLMRKCCKSDFTKIMSSGVISFEDLPSDLYTVIDGGHFINSLVWPKFSSFKQIVDLYVKFALKRYNKSAMTIIFDGYPNHATTKGLEQMRRAKRTSANINFTLDMQCVTSQSEFLANSHNKKKLISLICERLESAGINALISPADADRNIVTTAINKSESGIPVQVVGTDTDLLVLMIALTASNPLDLFFHKPATLKNKGSIYSIKKLTSDLNVVCDNLLFLYAITGCDTTSAIFNMGKIKAYKLLVDNSALRESMKIFNNSLAEKEDICSSGENFLLHLYGGAHLCSSLDDYRYKMYARKVAKLSLKSKFDIASLPPTSSAAHQHALRVYYQVQLWLGNNTLAPTSWGWREEASQLYPILSSLNFAPDEITELVSCNCKNECGRNCRCVKSGLLCSDMCGHCSGVTCSNVNIDMCLELDEND